MWSYETSYEDKNAGFFNIASHFKHQGSTTWNLLNLVGYPTSYPFFFFFFFFPYPTYDYTPQVSTWCEFKPTTCGSCITSCPWCFSILSHLETCATHSLYTHYKHWNTSLLNKCQKKSNMDTFFRTSSQLVERSVTYSIPMYTFTQMHTYLTLKVLNFWTFT